EDLWPGEPGLGPTRCDNHAATFPVFATSYSLEDRARCRPHISAPVIRRPPLELEEGGTACASTQCCSLPWSPPRPAMSLSWLWHPPASAARGWYCTAPPILPRSIPSGTVVSSTPSPSRVAGPLRRRSL